MRDRQSTPDTKSQHSQPTKEREAQRATAQEDVLATQQDPLTQAISRIGSAPSAKVHADLLSRATSDYPARSRQLMLQMQRQYGNRYVQRVMELSRQGEGEAEATPEVEAAIEQARGGGRSLDSGIQRQMESAFGTNFSGVRVHTDSTADALNQSLSARAFTTGQDIFFRQGQYNPGSSGGKELLAHELTHVVQQGKGLQSKLTVDQPGDRYEQEADTIARQVVDKINSSSLDQPIQRQYEFQGQEKELEGSIMPHGQMVVQQTSPLQMKEEQLSDTDLQRSRKLPKEFEYKAKSGDRARTLEETVIDVVGTGSALNSLVTSPLQTVTNAVTGLFSGFPSRATIRKQPVVQNAINTAWAAATLDYNERFGWITWDKNTDTYNVPAVAVGTPYRITPPPKPADPAPGAANQVFQVGEFHLHPPLDPGDPAMANPLNWPIGPSETDEAAAQADNSPGIVRDFDTVARTGGTTDYTYGPWTRTR